MFVDQNQYITPYLPQEAEEDIAKWRQQGKMAVQRVLPMAMRAKCRNCQDAEFVMVSFCKAGPFRQVPGISKGNVITWFDGTSGHGPGWFIVKNTISYTCPHCAGRPYALQVEGPQGQPPAWWTDA